jgi:hypothetical protein
MWSWLNSLVTFVPGKLYPQVLSACFTANIPQNAQIYGIFGIKFWLERPSGKSVPVQVTPDYYSSSPLVNMRLVAVFDTEIAI